MTIIRRAGPADAGRLAALAEETFRDAFASENAPGDMAMHCASHYGEAIQAAEIADPGRVTLLADQDGQLVGYAQLRWPAAPASVAAARPGEIQRLYVARRCHGRGVAHELMTACLAEMAHRGVDVVWLGVWERNPRAIAFYRKFGFEPVGEHTFTLGTDVQRDVLMARACEASGGQGTSPRR